MIRPRPCRPTARVRKESLDTIAADIPMARPVDTASPQMRPIGPQERLASMDVLRGVAILGIFMMNIQSFSMIGPAYMNPTAYGDLTGWNYAVWLVSHLFFDQQFLEVFSLLFGAGIIMMTERSDAKGQPSKAMHYRRMVLFLLIGVLHAYLLWYHDILAAYALCGMLLFGFRRKSPRFLFLLGAAMLTVPIVVGAVTALLMKQLPPEQLQNVLESFNPPAHLAQVEIDAYRGGWTGQMGTRAAEALFGQTFGFLGEMLWRAGGFILLGMAMMKLRLFGADRSVRTYLVIAAIGMLIGVSLKLYGVHLNFLHDWDFRYWLPIGSKFSYVGSIALVLAWWAMIMLLCKLRVAPPLLACLAAIGQLSLSCYLMQTLIGTTIFYGHGFGLYGKVDRVGQFLIVLAVWAVQLILAPLWLRWFRFGPVEWCWRAVTYLTPPVMIRRATG